MTSQSSKDSMADEQGGGETFPLTVAHDSNAPSTAISNSIMPHNLEAEQYFLGALMLDNSIIETSNDSLEEDHFYDPTHGRIFAAIVRLTSRGQLANPVTLKSYFVNDISFENVDIEGYLSALSEAVPLLSEAPSYAEEIRECYLRRALIQIADGVIGKARTANLEINASTQIEETEQQLFSLAERGQIGGGLIPFLGPITTALKQAETARNNPGQISGLGTGLNCLNKTLGGLQKSDLLIVAGRPGMGKTALATNIAFHIATTNRTNESPQHIAFFSLEMSSEQLAARILSARAGLSSAKIRQGQIDNHELGELVRAAQEIEKAPLYIDDTPALSISQLASRARRLKRQHDLGLIVVDYIQLLSPPLGQRQENRVQELSVITRMLKSIAKELDVPVLALSQLSRAVEMREDKRPNLADLRESGSIEQDADVVLFVYREEYYLAKNKPERREGEQDEKFEQRQTRWEERSKEAEGMAEIIIAKQRHGATGLVQLSFIAEHTEFVDHIDDSYLPEGH